MRVSTLVLLSVLLASVALVEGKTSAPKTRATKTTKAKTTKTTTVKMSKTTQAKTSKTTTLKTTKPTIIPALADCNNTAPTTTQAPTTTTTVAATTTAPKCTAGSSSAPGAPTTTTTKAPSAPVASGDYAYSYVNGGTSGSAQTTRYWDCCKSSCAWPGKTSVKQGPIRTCDKNDQPIYDDGNTQSGCNGGSAFSCSTEKPVALNDTVSYGYAAVKLAGGSEYSWCCACYELTFTSGAINGKKLVVQATNTGGDLGDNHFDLAIPGGGVGIFNGCQTQWNSPADGWGQRYGGVSSRSDCDQLPAALRDGCYWRFDWFQNTDNPSATFKQVTCPKYLTDKSNCIRSDQ